MDENRPDRRKMAGYTLAALLGLFVVAALVALATRFLPGPLSRLMRPAPGGQDSDRS